MAFLLPCFLWAAVRFGPNGVSLALVSTALVASWAGTHGRGPFYGLPAADAVLAGEPAAYALCSAAVDFRISA